MAAHIIIAEKSIAGERIAQILADSKVITKAHGRARYFELEFKKKPTIVLPLKGHIVEVDFPKKYSYWKGTDLKELVNAPIDYNPAELEIAHLLRSLGKEAQTVTIATDADREGESIGVEALRILQQTNPSAKVDRAYFSAMTPKELQKSFAELVDVDYNLSDSADSRREIDLVWGAVLTRYISIMGNRMGKDFISVGRVQTPVLALIVNREKERLAFEKKPYWEIIAHSEKDKIKFEAAHKEGKFWEEVKANSVYAKVKDAKEGLVKSISTKTRTLARPIPFNTTQFLRSATTLGMSAGQAMNIAESLYMQGFISYPRTDCSAYPESLNLKELLESLNAHAPYAPFVKQILAKPLNPSRGTETKDHPPIHPTRVPPQSLGEREWKVFELIARRFLATFMDDAQTENVSVEIDIHREPFIANGQTIIFAGWKAVYPYSALNETILPKLKEGELIPILKVDLLGKETQPPARYSQSALLKLMEENNLGTKATRAEIINKLYARGYISGLKSIEPNQIAFAVIDSLEKHCHIVTEPKMTAELEKEMDRVAEGKQKKIKVVDDSRKLLLEVLDQLLLHKMEVASDLRKAFMHQDVMAICPLDGGNLIIRKAAASGKRFLGCGNYPNCKQTYSLPQKGSLLRLNKNCPICKAPMIKLRGKKFNLEICLNMNCASKDEWKKKQAEKAAAPATPVGTPATPKPRVRKTTAKKV
ncbi:MAG: DNA topoisomerase I [Candidatus Iainarchaeum archaeon]|uniref:DNA topoisomerase 1 n=1 Tax=Candidatus Iainarchaeum sp. TaxID=3101447 RepID=A0A7T9DJT2_9ARCH|nr:MAG: DNA topoisomerase I [Candidatus Diapherotrites archaeon]